METFNVGDLVFYGLADTVYRVERVIQQTITADMIRYDNFPYSAMWPKEFFPNGKANVKIGDPLPPMLCIAMVYDSKQKKKKLRKRARQKEVTCMYCKHITKELIDEQINSLQTRIDRWEAIKFEVGVK